MPACRLLRLAALVGLGALLPQARAQTPNHRGTPLYGEVSLAAGFGARPHTKTLTAGGRSRNPMVGTGCVGYLATPQPDYRVRYTAGTGRDLVITATSTSDTALLIRTPGGTWMCDDDSDQQNPRVVLAAPVTGAYHIWVATVGPEPAQATLGVSESQPENTAATGGMNMGATPLFGDFPLQAGFGTHTVQVTAGGTTPTPATGPGCVGYLTPAQPDVRMTYEAWRLAPMEIYATSDTDTVLIIRQPGGSWVCNDDSDGRNPMVRLDSPRSGVYNIWVATYSSGTAQATLGFREIVR
jgi:hypothetical protein